MTATESHQGGVERLEPATARRISPQASRSHENGPSEFFRDLNSQVTTNIILTGQIIASSRGQPSILVTVRNTAKQASIQDFELLSPAL